MCACAYSRHPDMVKFKTPALPKLQAWAEARKFGPSKLAVLFGCEQSQASRWLRGESRPEPMMRVVIERETGGEVPQADWLTKAEQALLSGHGAKTTKGTGTDGR